MRSYKIIGYTFNDATYCMNCATTDIRLEEEARAIFASDEWTWVPTCDTCHEELDVNIY